MFDDLFPSGLHHMSQQLNIRRVIHQPDKSLINLLSGLSMTRMSQSCLIVSTVCLMATLIIGLFSVAGGQIVSCTVTATICLAAGRGLW